MEIGKTGVVAPHGYRSIFEAQRQKDNEYVPQVTQAFTMNRVVRAFVPSEYDLIDPEDKPFGALLPIEVQQRIMWWAKVSEVLEKVESTWHQKKEVHSSLQKLPVCILTDWIGCLEIKPFNQINWHGWCTNCDLPDCLEWCRWCELYKHRHSSIQLEFLKRKMGEERETIGIYAQEEYNRWEKGRVQDYYDAIQYSLMQVLIPFLCWTTPDELCFRGIRLNKPGDPATTLHAVNVASDMIRERWMARLNHPIFRNPRRISDTYFQRNVNHLLHYEMSYHATRSFCKPGFFY